MPTIEPFCAPGVCDPRVYSQGVKVTGAHFKGQAREVMGLIKALVESQGGTLQNVLRLNSYVTDMRYRPDYAAIREQFFGKRSPASTLVEVSALAHPDWLIEIEAIAVV